MACVFRPRDAGRRAEIGCNKRVTLCLRSPFYSFGYLSLSLAPKEEKRNIPELRIFLNYHLAAYNGANAHYTTRVGTGFSGREHMLKSPQPNAQAIRACAILRGFAIPTVQTAEAVCATAQSLCEVEHGFAKARAHRRHRAGLQGSMAFS